MYHQPVTNWQVSPAMNETLKTHHKLHSVLPKAFNLNLIVRKQSNNPTNQKKKGYSLALLLCIL